jgi:hypothetical protein
MAAITVSVRLCFNEMPSISIGSKPSGVSLKNRFELHFHQMAGELNFFWCRTCHGISQRSNSFKTPSIAAAFVVGSWWAIHHLLQRLLGDSEGAAGGRPPPPLTHETFAFLSPYRFHWTSASVSNELEKRERAPPPVPLAAGCARHVTPPFLYLKGRHLPLPSSSGGGVVWRKLAKILESRTRLNEMIFLLVL